MKLHILSSMAATIGAVVDREVRSARKAVRQRRRPPIHVSIHSVEGQLAASSRLRKHDGPRPAQGEVPHSND